MAPKAGTISSLEVHYCRWQYVLFVLHYASAIAVVVIVLHTQLVIVLYIAASYVVMMPAPTIKRFLVRFRIHVLIGNLALLPVTFMILLAAAVAYVLTRGVTAGAVVVMDLLDP